MEKNINVNLRNLAKKAFASSRKGENSKGEEEEEEAD